MTKKSSASSRREKRIVKREDVTIAMTDDMRARVERLAKTNDDAINYDDIPDVAHWDSAIRGKFYRPVKKPIIPFFESM